MSDQCTRHAHIPVVVVPAAADERTTSSRMPAPFGSFALVWALPEEHRREVAWIELGAGGTLAARGRQVCTGADPYVLEYELETSAGYVTERLRATIAGGPEVTLQRGRSPELDGVPTAISASPR